MRLREIVEANVSLGFRVERPMERSPPLDCFATVKLRADQEEGGVVFLAGTRGVIVDRYEDGTYGVEFAFPVEDVVMVKRVDLEPA